MENFSCSITLNNLTAAQIAAIGNVLNTPLAPLHQDLRTGEVRAITPVTPQPVVVAGPREDQGPAAEAAAEQPKPRRGRKPRNAAAAEPTTPPSGDLPLTSAEPAPSIDDVRKALSDLLARTDMTKCSQLLAEFGASRISELPADKYAAVVKACAEKQA